MPRPSAAAAPMTVAKFSSVKLCGREVGRLRDQRLLLEQARQDKPQTGRGRPEHEEGKPERCRSGATGPPCWSLAKLISSPWARAATAARHRGRKHEGQRENDIGDSRPIAQIEEVEGDTIGEKVEKYRRIRRPAARQDENQIETRGATRWSAARWRRRSRRAWSASVT